MVRTRGGTPVRVGVFVDVCVGAEGACAVKPLETPGRALYGFKPTGFDLGVFEAREAGGEVLEPPSSQSPRVGI